MKANKIYQESADLIYAKIGHAMMQKKQIEQQLKEQDLNIEELEFELKMLVRAQPYIQQIEASLIQEESNSGWKDKEV